MQQGGSFLPFFADYNIVESTSSQSQRPQKRERGSNRDTDDERGQLTEKDLFSLLKDVNGLPNDMQYLIRQIQNMYKSASLFGTNEFNNSTLANLYAQNIYKIKVANFNRVEYDKAYTEVEKNKGLNEIAIDTYGRVWGYDEDKKLTNQTINDYLKDPKFTPLTNKELLNLRANSIGFTFNNDPLDIVSNGIGLEEVNNIIKNMLTSLGTSEIISEGYTLKAGKQIKQGLEVLSELQSQNIIDSSGMTLDGLYKSKVITKEQSQQAQAALKYIYEALPDNAKNLLKLKSGNEKNPSEGAINIIKDLITSKSNQTISREIDYKGTLDKVLNGSSTEKGSDDYFKSSAYWNMITMTGGTTYNGVINRGSQHQMEINGVTYGSGITTPDGKPVGKTSLTKALSEGLQGIVIDTEGITFGNVSLTPEDLDNIMYNGGSGTVAILPITKNSSGKDIVDLDSLSRWEKFMDKMDELGIEDITDSNHSQEIVEALYENNLLDLIDLSTGEIKTSALGQFLIVDGYAVDHSNRNKFKDNDYISKVDDSDESLVSSIERALSTDSKQENYKIDVDNWYDWNGHNIIYEGSIYIPITSNQLQAATAAGQNLKEKIARQKNYEYDMWQKQRTAQRGSSDLIR